MGDENNRKYLSKEGLILFVNTIKDWLFTKVDKVPGMGLSSNDYTTAEKEKLSDIDSGAQVNVIESITVNDVAQTVSSDKSVDITVPTAVSDLDNDANYATTDEVAAGLAEKQDALDYGTPTGDDVGKALMPKTISNGEVTSWEFGEAGMVDDVQINGTSVVQDKVANIPIADIETEGVVKLTEQMYGGLRVTNGYLATAPGGHVTVKSGMDSARPIVPITQHMATFYGLSKAAGVDLRDVQDVTFGEYPDQSKSAIQSMLGVPSVDDIPEVPVQDVEVNGTSVVDQNGVANIPMASNNDYGVVKGSSVGSFNFTNGEIRINPASANEIKTGTNQYKALTPAGANTTTFYGLAKAAGDTTQSQSSNAVGQYTDGAKSAIKSMLGFATQSDITSAISQITQIEFAVVQSLPATGTTGTIYLIQHQHGDSDIYDEYIWIASSSSYEKIGNTDIDLTDYLQKSAVVSESDIDDIVAQAYAPTVGEEAVYLNKERLSYFWGEAKDYIDDGLATKMPIVSFGEKTTLVDTTTLEFAKDGDNNWYCTAENPIQGFTSVSFVNDAVYTITWDGVEYNELFVQDHEYRKTSGGFYIWSGIGNANILDYHNYYQTNAPFIVAYDFHRNKAEVQVFTLSTEETHTIKIEITTYTKKVIPEQYYTNTDGGRTPIAWGTGNNSIVEGFGSIASGGGSHAEGTATIASGSYSHAEGCASVASGSNGSHAEGYNTIASGVMAHAEGTMTTASGMATHAEGIMTTASGAGAHAEGYYSQANGGYSHVEGYYSQSNGAYSHVEGYETIANANYSHVFGEDNIPDSYDNWNEWVAETQYYVGDKVKKLNDANKYIGYICLIDNNDSTFNEEHWENWYLKMNYIEIVGNGLNTDHRLNARTLDWWGNEVLSGKLTVGVGPTADMDVATKLYVDTQIGTCVSDVQLNGTSIVSGGVANIPVATDSNFGVVKVAANAANNDKGITITDDGTLLILPAPASAVKAGVLARNPIVPANQDKAVFYGLAKASGDTTQSASSNAVGSYTDSAKASIKSMLGIGDRLSDIEVEVTGTTPTITANSSTRYICGEVTEVTFTPPASGTTELIFTSGSTVPTLTLPSTVLMPEWFVIEPNRIYQISIENSRYGAVASWPVA